MIAEGVGELVAKEDDSKKSVGALPMYFLEAADCQEGTHNAWLIRANTSIDTFFLYKHT